MTEELFIENKRADLSKGLSSLITYAVDDVKDFSSRNTSFSKTIILPGTARNNSLLGNVFNVTISNPYNSAADNISTNFNAAVGADCIIFQDHIQVFKGTLRLLEIVILDGMPEYEVSVYGELGGLVNSIGSKKIEDLDFSVYDHTWNFSNITGSWDAAPGSGYYYPLIDYGGASAGKVNYDIKTLRPGFYVKEYIDKIFADTPYRYESTLLNTDRFKKLLIPNNEKELYNRQLRALDIATSSFSFSSTEGVPTKRVAFSTVLLGGFTASDSNRIYTYAGATFNANLKFYATIHFTNSSGLPFVLKFKKNGTSVIDITFYGVSSPHTMDVLLGLVTIANADYLEMEVVGPVSGTWSVSFSTGPSHLWLENEHASPVPLNNGDLIKINGSLPKNVLQKDFLSSIVKLFNLYVYEDKNEKRKLYLEPYVDFYDLNVSGVIDWTNKIDRSKAIRIKPMSELNSRYYDFKFKQDSDYYNELYRSRYNHVYGNYLYDSQYEFANEKQSIDLIFSPTVLVGYASTDKVVSVMYKKNAGVEEKTDTNIRIIQTKKITGVTSWSIMDGATVLVSTTNYGYGGHYDDPDAPANDIHFGVPAELFFTLLSGAVNVTQFNVYWSGYMAEITDKDSKLMLATIKLSPADIYNFDFSQLIYVDGTYWVVNKIEDYNTSESDICKIELLKRVNLLY